ncbi:MAG: glycosyltransferase [Solirubrobacteraceae bacterium]
MSPNRTPILYLAPWVDYGGSDTNTLDWFRWIDRSRFAPSLITTQPSDNRRLSETVPYAEEVWALSELMPGDRFPQFIAEFIVSRQIELIHVMNSRIAFDLLPDFRALKRPPKVVVQLHVEEPTRDGYVRYVTTRYGNLVDAYSVSSAHVGDTVVGYGVPRDRVHTIPTGIDTGLFDRGRVQPAADLADETVHLLFVARLVEQKDPLLMVEVARTLAERNLPFCIHVIGGGELEPDMRARVDEYGLQDRVVFEAPTHELRPWYAGAALLLMTSVFEGVPVIVYEALAMELPIVAPALPGIVELMGDGGGRLVHPRDRVQAYADALEPLIRSREKRRKIGREGRELVMSRFSVQEMAAKHAELYERLLSERVAGSAEQEPPPIWRSSFRTRPARGTPRVSVITPCFNHGRVLRECVEAVRAQTYPDVEMIVVDDCSTDAETRSYFEELEADGAVRIVRLPINVGPSAARNNAIALASGRYLLPVDADNLLLPDAVARLVMQIQAAGEHVGFIYQNAQYFGNREDYFEAPVHNPWLLTRQNYIDTCALIDREVFELGVNYAEDIVFGHEDWDFYLQLATRGVHGEPARGKTLLYRKEGFTRSDLVEWTGPPFQAGLAARHPALFPTRARDEPASRTGLGLKARWAPALSLISIAPFDVAGPAWELTQAALREQRFGDFELLVTLDRDLDIDESEPPIRNLPARLAARPADALAHAVELSRGRHLLLTGRALPDLLCDPGSIERIVRLLEGRQREATLCLADVDERLHPFAVTLGDDPGLEPHSIAFSRADLWPEGLPADIDAGDPIGALARWTLIRRRHLEWRHLRSEWADRPEPSGRFHRVVLASQGPRAERLERELRSVERPLFGGAATEVQRWTRTPTWLPAATVPLLRSQRVDFEEWTVTTTSPPPPGFNPEHLLGVVHMRALQGTRRIVRGGEQGYTALPLGDEPTGDEMEQSLGYVEEVAFSMLEPLLLCRHARTGAPILICGEDDPLRGFVEWPQQAVLGYVDRFPVNPRTVPTSPPTRTWLRGLLRTVDPEKRRHRVALGTARADEPTWELGALLDRDPGEGVGAWVDDWGRLCTAGYAPARPPFDIRGALRWVGAPASWRGFGTKQARARAVARRTLDSMRHAKAQLSPEASTARQPQAWLMSMPGPERCALFSAMHPVTGDQLVTRDPSEPRELGYGSIQLLGYALALAPVTGTLRRPPLSVPWGSRFGEALTLAEDPFRDAD